MNDNAPAVIEAQLPAVTGTEERRAIAEVSAQVSLAKRFPRDEFAVAASVTDTCKRISVAEKAFYSYPKGGSTISGPSIRMAEMLAQAWGNIQYGWKEVERDIEKRQSTVQAVAWDTQTNARQQVEFIVRHQIKANGQTKVLTDERDIGDHIANQASRKLRGCILRIVPAWLQDEAVRECKRTLANENKETPAQRAQRMVKAFSEFGVTQPQLEKKVGHPLAEITLDELAELTGVFNALRDGGKVSEHFEFSDVKGAPDATAAILDAVEDERKKA